MLRKGIRKYIFNPVVGFLPFVLYIVLHALTDVAELHAITISLVSAVTGELAVRFVYKSKMYSITFFVSAISLVFTLLLQVFTENTEHDPYTYVVFCEIMIATLLVILKVSQRFIARIFFREKNVVQKAWLNEFYHIVSLIQYAFTGHLFFLLIYRSFRIVKGHPTNFDLLIFAIIPMIILLVIGIYGFFRTSNIISKLRMEEWLPIVTENGTVTGKIAKSVSVKMKNKFLHPMVRVALVSQEKVFLQPRETNDLLNPEKLDYPFEKYMLFSHQINLAARNSISQMMGHEIDIPLKFLLKYTYENEDTKRLIFLFVANIEDETLIKRTERMTGKFWTIKQIEQGFIDEIFSEPFELEFEYLKNTVLIPDNMTKTQKNI